MRAPPRRRAVEECRVVRVAESMAEDGAERRVRSDFEHERRVGHRPGDRPGRVLRVRDRDDPVWATNPRRRLEPDDRRCSPAGRGSSHRVSLPTVAAARLAAAGRPQSRSSSRTGPTRTYGLRVNPPRGAPAVRKAGGKETAEVRPLGRLALPRIAPAPAARPSPERRRQGPGCRRAPSEPGGRLHRIGRRDVVLHSRLRIPCSGPRTRWRRRSASRWAAMPIACGFVRRPRRGSSDPRSAEGRPSSARRPSSCPSRAAPGAAGWTPRPRSVLIGGGLADAMRSGRRWRHPHMSAAPPAAVAPQGMLVG